MQYLAPPGNSWRAIAPVAPRDLYPCNPLDPSNIEQKGANEAVEPVVHLQNFYNFQHCSRESVISTLRNTSISLLILSWRRNIPSANPDDDEFPTQRQVHWLLQHPGMK